MVPQTQFEIDDDLANRLLTLFRELLEAERRSIAGADDARRNKLRLDVARRKAKLGNDRELETLFSKHIAALPESERPENRIQEGRMIADWEGILRSELARWQAELAELENRPLDKPAIFSSAQNKALHLLQRAAQSAGLVAGNYPAGASPAENNNRFRNPDAISTVPSSYQSAPLDYNSGEWLPLSELQPNFRDNPYPPNAMQCPDGTVKALGRWYEVLITVANWLIQENLLLPQHCPLHLGRSQNCIINTEPHYQDGRRMRVPQDLANGMFMESGHSSTNVARYSRALLMNFKIDPAWFNVQLR